MESKKTTPNGENNWPLASDDVVSEETKSEAPVAAPNEPEDAAPDIFADDIPGDDTESNDSNGAVDGTEQNQEQDRKAELLNEAEVRAIIELLTSVDVSLQQIIPVVRGSSFAAPVSKIWEARKIMAQESGIFLATLKDENDLEKANAAEDAYEEDMANGLYGSLQEVAMMKTNLNSLPKNTALILHTELTRIQKDLEEARSIIIKKHKERQSAKKTASSEDEAATDKAAENAEPVEQEIAPDKAKEGEKLAPELLSETELRFIMGILKSTRPHIENVMRICNGSRSAMEAAYVLIRAEQNMSKNTAFLHETFKHDHNIRNEEMSAYAYQLEISRSIGDSLQAIRDLRTRAAYFPARVAGPLVSLLHQIENNLQAVNDTVSRKHDKYNRDKTPVTPKGKLVADEAESRKYSEKIPPFA